ncbi:glucokinase, partial [Sphaeroforma arctica JP610]
YGLLTLTADDVAVLNDVAPVEGGVVATVGAGTGLGECFLTKDPKSAGYTCWATEGGHTDWAPRTELELEFLDHMRLKYNQTSRISVERVISGNGISDIYEFLAGKYPDQINEKVHNDWKAARAQKGGVVGQNSGEGLCKQAMSIFFTAYASELGNAMLKWLPTGGLYVSGGIAAKNLSWILDDPNFKEVVFDKGRVSGAIKQCPVYVCKTEDVGERGAHLVAYNGYRKIIGKANSGAAKIPSAPLSPMPDKTKVTEQVRAMDEGALSAGAEPPKPAAEPKKEEPAKVEAKTEEPKAKEAVAPPK